MGGGGQIKWNDVSSSEWMTRVDDTSGVGNVVLLPQMALEACEKGASEVCVPAPMWRRLPGQQEVEPLPVEMVEWWRSWEAETGKWTPVQLLAAEVEAQRSERRAITAR
eukprot:gene30101-37589_t